MAACHSCAVIPERSCEHRNGLLDRALLVACARRARLRVLQLADRRVGGSAGAPAGPAELTGRAAPSVLQDEALHQVGGVQMVLVLPNADDRPVFDGQGLTDFTIPFLVAGELRTPEVGVGLRHRTVV